MIPVALAELGQARCRRGDAARVVTGLAVDSRLAGAGSLFVALHGRAQDGHEFLDEACARGAAAVACAPGRGRARRGVAVLEADDPLAALAAVGRRVRERSTAAVVAVAGAAGKTSTKDILRALCDPHRRAVASQESFNNEIGVPLTLARIEPETEVAVCELGTGAAGEVASLAGIVRPDVGVITAVGPEHLESLGSVEAAAAAEAELVAALRPGATIVLPAGERLLEPHRRDDLREITFGSGPGADVYPVGDDVVSALGQEVVLRTVLRTPHQRRNLAAAVAAYAALGLPLERVGVGAPWIRLSRWREQERRTATGVTVVNDAYNANPLSMRAAIEALGARRNGGRAVVVLGEMSELGADASAWHAAAGGEVVRAGIDLLVGVGPLARHYVAAAGAALETHWFADLDEARAGLPALLRPADRVLLKASRAAGLERLDEAIP